MESYRDFARVYDEFMDQTPYDEWLLNILNIFKEYKIDKDAQVLDLGCGTGKMARKLAREGYQVTAVDNSMDMLEIAASEEDDHILYVLQDMVSLELPQQVDAAVSICDCMNYILEEEDLKEARDYYGNRSLRIFLADGDALVLSQEKLCTILRLCRQYFPKAERITSYGTAQDILRKSKKELQELHELGLDMIYLGAESGSPEILEHIHKGVTVEEYVQAAERLRGTGIRLSVTLISGLGGQKLLKEHAIASAKLITAMKPDYLGFLTLLLEPGAPMLKEVKSGAMQLLTPAQVLEEMELFLTHVDSEGTVFRSNHASNYISLAGNLNRDISVMLEKIQKSRERDAFKNESMRRV